MTQTVIWRAHKVVGTVGWNLDIWAQIASDGRGPVAVLYTVRHPSDPEAGSSGCLGQFATLKEAKAKASSFLRWSK